MAGHSASYVHHVDSADVFPKETFSTFVYCAQEACVKASAQQQSPRCHLPQHVGEASSAGGAGERQMLVPLELELERAAAVTVAQFCTHESFLSTSCRAVFLGCRFCSLNSHIVCDAFLQQHQLLKQQQPSLWHNPAHMSFPFHLMPCGLLRDAGLCTVKISHHLRCLPPAAPT